jgi:hypothetical protein
MGSDALGHNHFAAIVIATSRTQIVRTLEFAAIGAFVKRFDFKRIVRPAVATAMGRYFSLWDSHDGTNSLRQMRVFAPIDATFR